MKTVTEGTIVYLNSGSPPLKVLGKTKEIVHVSWIQENELTYYASFPVQCLTRKILSTQIS